MNKSKKSYSLCAVLASFAVASFLTTSNVASAQAITTVFDPYVPGTAWTAPNTAPLQGPVPAPGSGDTPMGVNPGQTGSAALMPWNTYVPANTRNVDSSQINLPGGPGSTYAPYTMGMSMSGATPPPPSATGTIPSMLQVPAGQSAYATQVDVNSDGSLPADSAPIARTGRQSTQDYGLLRDTGVQSNDFGYPISHNPDRAQDPQVTCDGPRVATYPGAYGTDGNAQPNLPNSSYVNLGTGAHTLFQGPDIRARQTIAPY